MRKITLCAERKNLGAALRFANEAGKAAGLPVKELLRLELCTEEIYLNICTHAYVDGGGMVRIGLEAVPDGGGWRNALWLCFADEGPPFNPLARQEPNLAAPANDRVPGGLGIVMVRRYFPNAQYTRQDGKNILRLPLNGK